MMFCGYYNVFHTGLFSQLYPGIRVVFYRIKLFSVLLIFGYRDFGPIHDPLPAVAYFMPLVHTPKYGIIAPVNKHAKTGFTPPLHTFVAAKLFLSKSSMRKKQQ